MSENGERPDGAGPIVDTMRRDRRALEVEAVMARTERTGAAPRVHRVIDSPVGRLTLVATADGLAGVLWQNDRPGRRPFDIGREDPEHPLLVEAAEQLREYFAGRRKAFALPLDMAGTAFQRRVWGALLTIPYGETRSYGDVARQIGHPGAVRAVGAANGRNPVSIVAPCHRVIGADGSLTGFGGGLDVKARLLALEGIRTAGLRF